MRPFGKSWRWPISKIDMSILLFNVFLLLGLVVATVPDVLDAPRSTQVVNRNQSFKKCRYGKSASSMLRAICSNMEWERIPKNLRTDIQVLEVAVNRLRELDNYSLAPYKSLVHLYLGDNFIQSIEEGAFDKLQYLEVLDLTKNGCDNLPESLFQLPYLHTLYLESNKLTDSVFNVQVTSPIKFLQLARNKLTRIPYMGFQPNLVTLNMSENLITSIDTEDLAPYCSLKTLDLSHNMMKFTGCECQTLNAWVKQRQINMKPDFFDCTTTKNCANMQFSNQTNELYNECLSIIQQKVEAEKTRSIWVLVGSCLSAFIFIVFVGLFCIHRRNRKRHRKQKEQQQLAANNANTELLNSNLKASNS